MKHTQNKDNAIPAPLLLALGYVRVAAVPQLNPRSALDAQIGAVQALANANRIALGRVFEDLGESAHNLKRPGLLALLATVEAGQVNAIIVPDLARLARRADDLLRLMESFTRRRVRLISALDGRPCQF